MINSCAPFGQIPEGQKLEEIKKLKNFKNGMFQNIEKTKLKFNFRMLGIIWEFAFFHKKARKPDGKIPFRKISASELSIEANNKLEFYWLGHSSILILVNGKKILIDPMLTSVASPFGFFGPKRFFDSPLDIDDFPEIDLLLISHDHYDHLDKETVTRLSNKTKQFVVPIGVGSHLTHWGIRKEKIIELNWWENISLENNLEIICTPSKHFSGRGIKDNNKTLWASYVINSGDKKIYFGGDSGFFEKYEKIGDLYGPFDLTFLPIGAYHEMWSNFHMNPEEAVDVFKLLKGNLFVPIHWGTFNLAIHSWSEPIIRLKKYANKKGINYLIPVPGRKYRTLNPLLKTVTEKRDEI